MADLFGYDKTQIAIERIRQFEPPEGYWLGFSGGKDSIVLEYLTNMAGVRYDTHFNMTTVDPPELLQFIEKHYNGVHWEKPKKPMWQLVVDNKMPPTRLVRYCCEALKESGGVGRLVLTGIRWQESHARSKRQMVEQCRTDPRKRYLHPIIDWTEADVWEFILEHKLPYCSLYDEGFKRIGCVMCPMGSKRQRRRDIARFPNFYNAWMRTFDKMLKTYPDHYTTFHTAQDVMDWWLSDRGYVEDGGLFT